LDTATRLPVVDDAEETRSLISSRDSFSSSFRSSEADSRDMAPILNLLGVLENPFAVVKL
jgi:hypothetical protein